MSRFRLVDLPRLGRAADRPSTELATTHEPGAAAVGASGGDTGPGEAHLQRLEDLRCLASKAPTARPPGRTAAAPLSGDGGDAAFPPAPLVHLAGSPERVGPFWWTAAALVILIGCLSLSAWALSRMAWTAPEASSIVSLEPGEEGVSRPPSSAREDSLP